MLESRFSVDKPYIIALRRELHQFPELAFDLPKTIALVKRELDAIGVAYTEKYGKSSVVATINGERSNFTIGIRADMDALPVQETNDIPYRSSYAGKMHACGHDAHTAMLLGTAKALNSIRDRIGCRVKLLFQPSEEGVDSGAELMVNDGVMDDIDIIIGQHVENKLAAGTVGVCRGMSQAASRTVKIEFFGKAAHGTLPQTGVDALAMAVRCYMNIQMMLAREMDPFARYVCSFGKLHAGEAQNVLADHAELLGTIRTYDMQVDGFILSRIEAIARHAAQEVGGRAEVGSSMKCFPVFNDYVLSDCLVKAAEKVVGQENIAGMTIKMSSEDFSQYLTRKPGVFFRLGTMNREKGCFGLPHNNDFQIDEEALAIGSQVCVQFVLDNMGGIGGLPGNKERT